MIKRDGGSKKEKKLSRNSRKESHDSSSIAGGATFKNLRNKASRGNTKAAYELALYLKEGNEPKGFYGSTTKRNLGLAHDHKRASVAFGFFQKAATGNQPPADAMWRLGECYADGYGVIQSMTKAFHWYKKAADAGSISGMVELGVCLLIGKGCSRSPSDAFKYIRKAAEEGHVVAEYLAGQCYEEGCGIEEDIDQAKLWYKRASHKGYELSVNKLKFLAEKERKASSTANKDRDLDKDQDKSKATASDHSVTGSADSDSSSSLKKRLRDSENCKDNDSFPSIRKQRGAHYTYAIEYDNVQLGDTVEALVDGSWVRGTVVKVVNGHPILELQGMLGRFSNLKLRQYKAVGKRWTEEECSTLFAGIQEYGNDWNAIWEKCGFKESSRMVTEIKAQAEILLDGGLIPMRSRKKRQRSKDNDSHVSSEKVLIQANLNMSRVEGSEDLRKGKATSSGEPPRVEGSLGSAASQTSPKQQEIEEKETGEALKSPQNLASPDGHDSKNHVIEETKEQSGSGSGPGSYPFSRDFQDRVLRLRKLYKSHHLTQIELLDLRFAMEQMCEDRIKESEERFDVDPAMTCQYLNQVLMNPEELLDQYPRLLAVWSQLTEVADILKGIRKDLLDMISYIHMQILEMRREQSALQDRLFAVETECKRSNEEIDRMDKEREGAMQRFEDLQAEYIKAVFSYGFQTATARQKIIKVTRGNAPVPERLIPLKAEYDRRLRCNAVIRKCREKLHACSKERKKLESRLSELQGVQNLALPRAKEVIKEKDYDLLFKLFNVGDQVKILEERDGDSKIKWAQAYITSVFPERYLAELSIANTGTHVRVENEYVTDVWLHWNEDIYPIPRVIVQTLAKSSEKRAPRALNGANHSERANDREVTSNHESGLARNGCMILDQPAE
mmetsp:Transcript_27635/g.38418  ORF Transcript_27635/g.38418 Transcript_27635/m.38418 type:complete len:900 (-) Transcript_27635:266-2965(-)